MTNKQIEHYKPVETFVIECKSFIVITFVTDNPFTDDYYISLN